MYEYAIAIGIPAIGVALAVGKYFLKKERCFTILKNKVEQLDNDSKGSDDIHDGLSDEINQVSNELAAVKLNQEKNFIYLKLLLDNAGIKHD